MPVSKFARIAILTAEKPSIWWFRYLMLYQWAISACDADAGMRQ
jgi:hypothetical protein